MGQKYSNNKRNRRKRRRNGWQLEEFALASVCCSFRSFHSIWKGLLCYFFLYVLFPPVDVPTIRDTDLVVNKMGKEWK